MGKRGRRARRAAFHIPEIASLGGYSPPRIRTPHPSTHTHSHLLQATVITPHSQLPNSPTLSSPIVHHPLSSLFLRSILSSRQRHPIGDPDQESLPPATPNDARLGNPAIPHAHILAVCLTHAPNPAHLLLDVRILALALTALPKHCPRSPSSPPPIHLATEATSATSVLPLDQSAHYSPPALTSPTERLSSHLPPQAQSFGIPSST